MRVDNVTFVDCEVRKLTKERFLEMHSGLWPGMKDKDRKKKLSDVYDRICGKSREDRDK